MEMKRVIIYGALVGALFFTACSSGYSLMSVEGGRVPVTKEYDVNSDEVAAQILEPYKHKIDSVMAPVIGHAANRLEAYRPESPLSNLIADILVRSSSEKAGIKADVGVMNMGGIRNILNEGEITVGDIYEIAPFQNALAIVTMKGDILLELFKDMAAVHGEGLSGARLVISKDGKLIDAKVGGKPVDPEMEYHVATIDYLAEGNDRMDAFKKAITKTQPKDVVLRDLLIDYVKYCDAKGEFVDAKVEGRIVER